MSRSSANFLLLLAGIVWGMGFVTQQTAMDDIGPMLFMALRFLLAFLVVLPFALLERRRQRGLDVKPGLNAKGRLKAIYVGLFFFGTMAFQQVGLLTTTVTSAGFLTGLYVVIVPVIVLVLLKKHQHWIVWPGSLTALLGIYLLGNGSFTNLSSGDLLVIVSAIIGAGHIVMMAHTVQRHAQPVEVAATQFATAGIISIFAYLLFAALPFTRSIEPAIALEPIINATPEILYSGIFAGGLAFTLMAIGQRYTREADAAVLLSSEALFAALFGALFLAERLHPAGYVGCGLIFLAILLVQLVPALSGADRTQSIAHSTIEH